MTRSKLLVASILSVVAFIVGCTDGEESASSGGTVDTACGRDGRKDVYVAGLARTGGPFQIRVVDALPAPPSKGKNALTLELRDASGAPVDAAQVSVLPFMPDHGHGSAATPLVEASGGGRYTVSNLVLTMPGLWEVRVDVKAAGAAGDVTFAFCVDG